MSYNVEETFCAGVMRRMLRIQPERQEIPYLPSLREYTQYYGIHGDMLNCIDKPITILHPGPINRGVERSSDVSTASNQSYYNK